MQWEQYRVVLFCGEILAITKYKASILSAHQIWSGQFVHIDHFVCSTRDQLLTGYRIKDPKLKRGNQQAKSNSGGYLFIDRSTGHIHIELQIHLNTLETIQAVNTYEKWDQSVA